MNTKCTGCGKHESELSMTAFNLADTGLKRLSGSRLCPNCVANKAIEFRKNDCLMCGDTARMLEGARRSMGQLPARKVFIHDDICPLFR